MEKHCLEKILKEKDYLSVVTMNDGTPATKENWSERRAEMIELLEKYSYGRTRKPEVKRVWGEFISSEWNCYAFKLKNEKINVHFETELGVMSFPVEFFIPKNVERPPVFMHLAFGNVPNKYIPVEEITDAGYALCVIYYKDMLNDNDFADFSDGLGKYFGMTSEREPEEWGKIGIWAYGASRVLDYMKQYRTDVDTDKVAIIGHSRLGKTALWCGAQDERFAAVISNNSGYGGAASSKHGGGERVADFIRVGSFDWFCENFKLFRDEREDSKPYDQSFLLALIAPRYLLVGSAVDDKGADPESEFLTTLHASAAWELLGRDGLITPDRMPKPGDRFGEGNIQYHLRAHGHFLSREDWGAYIKFLDEKFKGENNDKL